MTAPTIDLRDHTAAFDAAARRLLDRPQPPQPRLVLVHARPARCHPDRPCAARGLCDACYERNRRRGTLADHPRHTRTTEEFADDYRLLRSEGYTRTQIAERLGMRRNTVDTAYLRAVKAGALTPDRRTA